MRFISFDHGRMHPRQRTCSHPWWFTLRRFRSAHAASTATATPTISGCVSSRPMAPRLSAALNVCGSVGGWKVVSWACGGKLPGGMASVCVRACVRGWVRTYIREDEGEGRHPRQIADEIEQARPVGPEGCPLRLAELAWGCGVVGVAQTDGGDGSAMTDYGRHHQSSTSPTQHSVRTGPRVNAAGQRVGGCQLAEHERADEREAPHHQPGPEEDGRPTAR